MSRAREEYEAQVGGVLSHIYKREGEFLVVDPADLDTPLTQVLEEERGSTRVDRDYTPDELKDLADASPDELLSEILSLRERIRDAGLRTQRVFFDFLFADGPDPIAVLERLYLYVSVRSRHHVWGANDTEISMLFGHSKQNWQHKVEKVIEDLVTRFSRVEFIHAGGKNLAARLAYARQRKGNTSRKGGGRNEPPPLPAKMDDDETLSSQAKRRAKAMRDEAERRRLAREIGCRPEEIDLSRIDPKWGDD